MPGRHFVRRVDRVDARRWRTSPNLALDAPDRRRVPFHEDLNPAVGQIGDPSAHAFEPRRFVGEEPEPDALHTAAYPEPPGHEHRDSIAGLYFPSIVHLYFRVRLHLYFQVLSTCT